MAKGPVWEVANFDEKMDGLNAPSAVGLGLSPGSFFSICQILMIQAGLLNNSFAPASLWLNRTLKYHQIFIDAFGHGQHFIFEIGILPVEPAGALRKRIVMFIEFFDVAQDHKHANEV